MSLDMSQRISVTRDQAAEMVGLSRSTILRAIAAGDLVEHYVTSKPVIFVDELRAWIAAAPTEGQRR